MKRSSIVFMGFVYLFIGFLFIVLAVHRVTTDGWVGLAYLFIGVAAMDIMIAIRYFRTRPPTSQSK